MSDVSGLALGGLIFGHTSAASRAAGPYGDETPPDLSPWVFPAAEWFEPHLPAHWKRAEWPYFYATDSMPDSLVCAAKDRSILQEIPSTPSPKSSAANP